MKSKIPFLFVFFFLAITIILDSCNAHPVQEGLCLNADGEHFTVGIGGSERTGVLHIPSTYNGVRKYSLVIALHGANNTGESFRGMGFDKQADILDFIMVYPDGAGMRWDSPEDTRFIQLIIDGMQQKYKIDPKRIYLTGHSAGSIKAYETATALSGKIAAIAPVAGLVAAGSSVAGINPVSVLHVQAKDDPEVPFQGTKEWGFMSAYESVDFWKKINGNSGAGEVFYKTDGIQGTVWRGKEADTAILEYETGRHTWLPLATEFICDFFYNHPARENSIKIKTKDLPQFATPEETLLLKVAIAKPETVSSVEYYSKGILIGKSIKAPFSYQWKNPARGLQHISARAYLNNGTVICTTFNPSVIVARPILAVDTATSSSNEVPGLAARYAIDRNILTRWSSAWTDEEYIELDLNSVKTISGVSLFWEMAYARAYTIDISTDRDVWTTVYTCKDDGKGEEEFIDFDPVKARYIRMNGIKRATEYGYSLWEFIVHGE